MLPTEYQECYYVYDHVDPQTGEIKYIGHGWGSRAWQFGSYRSDTSDVTRDRAHADWAYNLFAKGYLPEDIVEIRVKMVSKSEACAIEQEAIRQHTPEFNKPVGRKLLKMTKDDIEAAKAFREEGMSYKDIGDEIGISTMTVWRTLTGSNKNEL